MPRHELDELLYEAPWLRRYGGGLLNALLRAGVLSLQELLEADVDAFEHLRGVGANKRRLLGEAQREALTRMRSGNALPSVCTSVTLICPPSMSQTQCIVRRLSLFSFATLRRPSS